MKLKTQKRLVLLLMAALPLVPLLRIWNLARSDQPVFWLQELWAPVAVSVVGMVTCLEVLLKKSEK
jgi:hypothetical protein